jgi:hypothetical protein
MKVTKHVEQLLRQGRKPKELIELGFPKSTVTRVYRQLKEEKATLKAKAPEETAQAETHLQIPPESPETIATIWQKVQSMANDLLRIDSLIQVLSEVATVITAAREFGNYMHDTCPHQKEALCTLWTWSSEGDIPADIGEPVAPDDEKGEWHIKPSPLYCAMCPFPFEDRLDDVEDKLLANPLSGARDVTCQGCGAKGMVATSIKCTKCGRETYLGWWPKKE